MIKKYLELLAEVERMEREEKEIIIYRNWEILLKEHSEYSSRFMGGSFAIPSEKGKNAVKKLLENGISKEEIIKKGGWYTIEHFLE